MSAYTATWTVLIALIVGLCAAVFVAMLFRAPIMTGLLVAIVCAVFVKVELDDLWSALDELRESRRP